MKKFFLLFFCLPFIQSLSQSSSIGGVINDYTPIINFSTCDNVLIVESASAFKVGDTVLIIQMKGAVIDSSNTSTFGTIIEYKNSGNYEFNYIKSKNGNTLELKYKLTRQYDFANGKVQLIRVPYYQNASITSPLTCAPWDGSKGGVLVLNVANTISLNADIDVSGKGFRGGNDPVTNPPSFNCYENQFYYPANPDLASEKGEGIALISLEKSYGKGALANGGGGGNSHNSGGAGGSNAGLGGNGGYHFEGSPCNITVPFDNRGIGGKPLTYNNGSNKIFLGGGGGAGHSNNPQGFQAKGGNGAGIAIIISDNLQANSRKISANGITGNTCNTAGPECHEGMGGGGGGGTVLLTVNNFIDAISVDVKGGKGADMNASGFLKLGPGGGGGGGIVWLSKGTLPSNVSTVRSGGQNGVAIAYSNDAWGAGPGQNGYNLFNLQIPFGNIDFKPNIDSVRFNTVSTCLNVVLEGLGYTNTNAIDSWLWSFGDGNTANTQNVNHTYHASGAYPVKLVIIDMNGCKDSITSNININNLVSPVVKTNADTILCEGSSVQLNAAGANSYSWSPSTGLNNTNIANPIAKPATTMQYVVTGKSQNGCAATDTVMIVINSKPIVIKSNDTAICKNSSVQLFASGGNSYKWSPAIGLDNTSVANPIATPPSNATYFVTLTDANNCINTDSIKVNILPDPVFSVSQSHAVCQDQSIQLTATGGDVYAWQPSASLSNAIISSPVATPPSTTTYSVHITELTCNNSITLSTTVTVRPLPSVKATKSNDIDCTIDFSELNATGAKEYLWKPSGSLNNANIANPIASPTIKTEYIVQGKDENGCSNYDTVTIDVTNLNKSGYWVASAFTPNGDGLNDCFRVKHWGIIETIDLKVFNRWGEIVFQTTNSNDCWDGTYKGLRQPSAVFVYLIKAKTICGEVFKKGIVTLIR